MRRDPSAIGRAVGNDHPGRDPSRPANRPCLLARDLNRQPALSIDGSDQLVDIGNVGLELDDENDLPLWVKGEDVDDASLAEDRERNLRSADPACQETK